MKIEREGVETDMLGARETSGKKLRGRKKLLERGEKLATLPV